MTSRYRRLTATAARSSRVQQPRAPSRAAGRTAVQPPAPARVTVPVGSGSGRIRRWISSSPASSSAAPGAHDPRTHTYTAPPEPRDKCATGAMISESTRPPSGAHDGSLITRRRLGRLHGTVILQAPPQTSQGSQASTRRTGQSVLIEALAPEIREPPRAGVPRAFRDTALCPAEPSRQPSEPRLKGRSVRSAVVRLASQGILPGLPEAACLLRPGRPVAPSDRARLAEPVMTTLVVGRARPGRATRESASLLQLAPAAGPVVGDDLPEYVSAVSAGALIASLWQMATVRAVLLP